ncbi:MAG: addiction module protein [Pirellulales bacterium]|nr:addiction module protein [Pirellulales bacterium]
MSLLPSELRNLPIGDRLEIVTALWDSIAEDAPAPPLTPAQQVLVDERRGARAARPDASRGWDEVNRDVLGE